MPVRGEGGVPPRRAVGYVKVSTEGQADRGVSLDAQAEKIRAMATVHDVELMDVIVDGGESGKSLSRPGIDQLLGMVDRREVQVVIIAKLDRLTRSVRDLGELLEGFQKKGVALVSVGESLDTGSAAGRLVLNVMASVSQWEREAIGERTRDALRHKRAQGLRAGNVPFGYALAEDGQTLMPCEGEQQVLANLRSLREQRLSLRAIASELNARGLRTRSGAPWRHEYVVKALRSSAPMSWTHRFAVWTPRVRWIVSRVGEWLGILGAAYLGGIAVAWVRQGFKRSNLLSWARAMTSNTAVRFTSYPLTEAPPRFIPSIVESFRSAEPQISSEVLAKGLTSDAVAVGPLPASRGAWVSD